MGPEAHIRIMPDKSALIRHFEYWDKYIAHWLECKMPCNPFMPEPWWGWSYRSDKPLYSVVINLNPGRGGEKQTHGEIGPVLGDLTYSEAMSEALPKHLAKTHKWHNGRRAKPILSRLRLTSNLPELDIKNENDYISHHLSIELSPLHSESSKDVEGYVVANSDNVLEHTLRFAAEASRHAEEPLRGVVIVRCSARRFMKMFRDCRIVPSDRPIEDNPCWCRINSPGLEDIHFVCVRGVRNRITTDEIENIIEFSKSINNK